ncbi:hypothetical protein AK812_SmicGene6281 [Symbiodinium microadriaticum]|uniref:Uncharacterized protein n=1 Tax=Symbiodinium microadriaticum TaxID=2951 RepID=A0A1Q9ERL8_SYMMI|nr:hypothetical protein AK812_SmicGene6281 [Symbiodinium microadriaticum]
MVLGYVGALVAQLAYCPRNRLDTSAQLVPLDFPGEEKKPLSLAVWFVRDRKNHLVFDIGNTTFRMETAFGQYRSVDAQLGQLWHYYNKTGILATGRCVCELFEYIYISHSVRAFTFGNDTEISMLEFQFKSWFHANGSVDDAAHLVAYLVKVKGGMGVVLSYKGSTNRKDWQANLDSGSEFFRDSPELPKSLKHARVEVHHGFKWHKTSLDLRMNMFMMEPVEKILRYVKPRGGLRIENEGDVVTFLGYGNVHG